MEFVRWGRTDGVELFCKKCPKVSKRAKKVPMTFGPFSKSATNSPNITTKIRIAPRSGASGIAIVIFGAFVADFENGPKLIGTFGHFLKLLGTFCKKVQAHLARPIWPFPICADIILHFIIKNIVQSKKYGCMDPWIHIFVFEPYSLL